MQESGSGPRQQIAQNLPRLINLCLCLLAVTYGPAPALASDSLAQQLDFDALIWETLPRFDIDPGQIPPEFREKIRKLLYDYVSIHRKPVQAMLRRCLPYLKAIKRTLRKQRLPTYFAYVPLAESAFRIRAMHSKSGARGLWQLMPETARAYGLEVSKRVDERLNPLLATEAAARYLHELQDMFGSEMPLLVLAAYNYGESNIYKAIIRARTRNIWTLMEKWQLPDETRTYLAKMVTLWLIVSNAREFRLAPTLEPSTPALPPPDIPRLPEKLLDANDQMLLSEISVSTIPWRVCLSSSANAITDLLSSIPVHDACWHTVQGGENPWDISREYGIHLATLKHLNELKGANPVIYPGQLLAVCRVPFSRPRTISNF